MLLEHCDSCERDSTETLVGVDRRIGFHVSFWSCRCHGGIDLFNRRPEGSTDFATDKTLEVANEQPQLVQTLEQMIRQLKVQHQHQSKAAQTSPLKVHRRW